MIADEMHRLWVAKVDLDHLAAKLEAAGEHEAARELNREAAKLGCQLLRVEGVLDDYAETVERVEGGAS